MHFADAWLNSFVVYTSIITFLMIFLMQRGQNKDIAAMHLKLNELINATQHADNSLINVEESSEKKISEVHEAHAKIKDQT